MTKSLLHRMRKDYEMPNNMLVYDLANEKIEPKPDKHGDLLKIEDNVGESIHIHYRNVRIDLTVSDFVKIADELEDIQ